MFIETVRDYIDYLNTFPAFVNGDINILELVKETLVFGGHGFKDLIVYIFSFAWLRDFIEVPLLLRHSYTCIENLELVDNAKSLVKVAEKASTFHLGVFSLVDLNKFYSSHVGTGFFNSFFLSCPMTVSHFLTIRALVINGLPAGMSSGLGMVLGQMLFLGSVLLGFENVVNVWVSLQPFAIIAGVYVLIRAMEDLNNDLEAASLLSLDPPEDETEETYEQYRPDLLQKFFRTTLTLSLLEQASIFNCFGNLTTAGTSTVLETAGSNFWLSTGGYLVGLILGSCIWSLVWGFFISTIRQYVIGYSNKEIKFLHNACMSLVLAFSLASFPYYGTEYFTGKVLGFLPGDPYMSWAQHDVERSYFPLDFERVSQNDFINQKEHPDHRKMLNESLLNIQEEEYSQFDRTNQKEDVNSSDAFVFRRHSRGAPQGPPLLGNIEATTCKSEARYCNIELDRTRLEEDTEVQSIDLSLNDEVDKLPEGETFLYVDGLQVPTYSSRKLTEYRLLKASIEATKTEMALLRYQIRKAYAEHAETSDDRNSDRESGIASVIREPTSFSTKVEDMPSYQLQKDPNIPRALVKAQKKKERLEGFAPKRIVTNKSKLFDDTELIRKSEDRAYLREILEENENLPDEDKKRIPRGPERLEMLEAKLKTLQRLLPSTTQNAEKFGPYSHKLYQYTARPDRHLKIIRPTHRFYKHKDLELGRKAECAFAFRNKYYSNPVYTFLLRLEMYPFSLGQSKEEALDADEEALLFAHRAAIQDYANSISTFGKQKDGGFARQVSNQQFKGTLGVLRSFKFAQIQEPLPLGYLPPPEPEQIEENIEPEPEKKSFFRSLFSRKNKKTATNTEVQVDDPLDIIESYLANNAQQNSDDQKSEVQDKNQEEASPNFVDQKEEIHNDNQKESSLHSDDKTVMWKDSKIALKHKVLKYDQPLPQRIKDQENFAFHEELELTDNSNPLTPAPMVDQSVPMYIGWDGDLRKFLVKTHISPNQVYTSTQMYTDPQAINNHTDLNSETESEYIKTTRPTKEIPPYYSFQSWAKGVEKVKRRSKKTELRTFRLPTANYSKQQLSDLKKIFLGQIFTEAHIENEKRFFKKDLQKMYRQAEKKVKVLLNYLPDYDWVWNEDTLLNEDVYKEKDEEDLEQYKIPDVGVTNVPMSKPNKFKMTETDINYVSYMSSISNTEKVVIDRNDLGTNYADKEKVEQLRSNMKQLYSSYFNLGSTAPPGVYGLAWPGVQHPGSNSTPSFLARPRSATQHLLDETLDDLKKKNKERNVPKEQTGSGWTTIEQPKMPSLPERYDPKKFRN